MGVCPGIRTKNPKAYKATRGKGDKALTIWNIDEQTLAPMQNIKTTEGQPTQWKGRLEKKYTYWLKKKKKNQEICLFWPGLQMGAKESCPRRFITTGLHSCIVVMLTPNTGTNLKWPHAGSVPGRWLNQKNHHNYSLQNISTVKSLKSAYKTHEEEHHHNRKSKTEKCDAKECGIIKITST